ncbi:MAG: hypothetical protein KF901_14615 [Myxococcales bacterium]|nr:hypothetical protein [Myxococcales bacterium]
MKNLLLGTALSLATTFPVLAQPRNYNPDAGVAAQPAEGRGQGRRGHGHGHGHRNPEAMLERMTQDLQLQPNQVQQLRRIFDESQRERANLRGQRTPEARQAHRALMERTKSRVDAVLTPAQRTRAQQLREARMSEHMNRRLERMQEQLSLQPAQVQRIRQILTQAQAERRNLGHGPEHRDAHRALHERTKTQIDGVLDANQRARFEQMRERRGERGHRGPRGPRGERGERGARGPRTF